MSQLWGVVYSHIFRFLVQIQSSGAVWQSRWTPWAPVPNKPTVSVDVKQHFKKRSGAVWESRWPSWVPAPNKPTVSVDIKQHFNQHEPAPPGSKHLRTVGLGKHRFADSCVRVRVILAWEVCVIIVWEVVWFVCERCNSCVGSCVSGCVILVWEVV